MDLTKLSVAAVVEIARHERDNPTARPLAMGPITDLLTPGKPRSFEMQFRKLAHAGILESIRGPGGGYKLAKSPSVITVDAILEELAGDPDLGAADQSRAERETRAVFVAAGNLMADYLDGVTIADILRKIPKAAAAAA